MAVQLTLKLITKVNFFRGFVRAPRRIGEMTASGESRVPSGGTED